MDSMHGFRRLKIRRLFRQEMQIALDCYRHFDFLHYNPVNRDSARQIMALGEFWGIFDGEKAVGCTYMVPSAAPFFSGSLAAWEIEDLLGIKPGEYTVCGFMWVEDGYDPAQFYCAAAKLWTARTEETQGGVPVCCVPAHLPVPFDSFFGRGFELAGLRGLDNLVPNYIFVKEREKNKNESPVTACPRRDTKAVSAACEHGYRGFGTDEKNNILFRR